MKLNETSRVPYYLQAKEHIKQLIAKTISEKRARLSTVREIAGLLDVSVFTVNNAVRELKNEGLLYSRQKKGIYIAKNAAGILDMQKSEQVAVGVAFSDAFQRRNSFYFNEILDGIAAARSLPFNLQLLPLPPDIEAQRMLGKTLRAKNIAGLLLASRMSVQVVAELMRQNIPFVWINNDLPYEKIYCVMADLYQTVNMALNYLKARGYRRVGLINFWWNAETLAAYKNMLSDKGFSDEPDLIHVFEGATLDEEQRLAGRVAGELMKRRNPPDSLFLFGEGTISGAYKSLHEMGVGVPGDVGLIGCAQRTYAEHFPLPLTCAVYPNKIMAEKAVRLLWSLIQGETPARAKIMVPSELMAGETCGEKKQKQQKKGKDSKGHE